MVPTRLMPMTATVLADRPGPAIRALCLVFALAISVSTTAQPPVADAPTPADQGQPGPATGSGQDGGAGVLIFGERLLHFKRDEDGGGSGRFQPPLPADDKAMLLAAMKSLTRAIYGLHGIDVQDLDGFDPRIGRVTELEDFDFDYRFMLDGTVTDGVRIILVQRKEAERTIDAGPLLPEMESL